jgi:hypothetical protein
MNQDAGLFDGGGSETWAPPPDAPQRDTSQADEPRQTPDAAEPSDGPTDAGLAAPPDAAADAADVDGPPITDASAPDGRCDFVEEYEFGPVGGLVAYTDRSYLSPGNRYRHVRTPVRGNGSVLSCEVPLPACSMTYLQTAYYLSPRLTNPEVTAALSPTAPPLFGFDDRPMDGTVLELKTASGSLLMGSECGNRTPCRPIPQVIRELKAMLTILDAQQLAMPPCQAAGFPR